MRAGTILLGLLLCWSSVARAADPIHLLEVVYVYSVDLQEVNWHTSDEPRAEAIRDVSKGNSRITLIEYKPGDEFNVTVIVPFEKNHNYVVKGSDERLKTWVDMQRKGYATIKLKPKKEKSNG